MVWIKKTYQFIVSLYIEKHVLSLYIIITLGFAFWMDREISWEKFRSFFFNYGAF